MYVITGGGSGIGRALAHALAARKQEVLIIGRRADCLAETASNSPYIQALTADITAAEGCHQIQAKIAQTPIQALIHNAGTVDPIARLEKLDMKDWEATFQTNLFAPLRLTQQLLPLLEKGRVLHIGSGVAHFPVEGWSAYCASKAALFMLTRCFQLEMERPKVSSVMPGIVDTSMSAHIRESTAMNPEKLAFFKGLHQKNRLIKPETVALFLTWLLMDIDGERYSSQEWDIYDTSHHAEWLISTHYVPPLE